MLPPVGTEAGFTRFNRKPFPVSLPLRAQSRQGQARATRGEDREGGTVPCRPGQGTEVFTLAQAQAVDRASLSQTQQQLSAPWHTHTPPPTSPALFAQAQGHWYSRAEGTDLVPHFPTCLEWSCRGCNQIQAPGHAPRRRDPHWWGRCLLQGLDWRRAPATQAPPSSSSGEVPPGPWLGVGLGGSSSALLPIGTGPCHHPSVTKPLCTKQ